MATSSTRRRTPPAACGETFLATGPIPRAIIRPTPCAVGILASQPRRSRGRRLVAPRGRPAAAGGDRTTSSVRAGSRTRGRHDPDPTPTRPQGRDCRHGRDGRTAAAGREPRVRRRRDGPSSPFGPPETWRDDDLIAVSADFDPDLALAAYAAGVFPMPVRRGLMGWWSPLHRGVLPLDG